MEWRAAGILAAAWLLAACPPTPPAERVGRAGQPAESTARQSDEDRLARVNGETLTRGMFERRLDALPDYARARYRSAERRKAFLESLVRFEVMADVAERRGLGRHPRVLEAMKTEVAEQAVRETLRQRLSIDDISEQAVERAYREEPERYRRPQRRRVAVLVTDRKGWAAQLRAKIIEKGTRGSGVIPSFRRTASSFSLDTESAAEGGDFGWVVPPGQDPEHPKVAEIVYGLAERGRVSEPFELDGRWWLALWYKRQPPQRQSLDEVSRDIRHRLYEQRRRELRGEIRAEWRRAATVQLDRSTLEELGAPDKSRRLRPETIPVRQADTFPPPDWGRVE